MAGFQRNMTLEQAHNERRDRQLEELTRKMDRLVEIVEGQGRGRRGNGGSDSPSDPSSNSSSDSGSSSPVRRRHRRSHKDDFRDVKLEPAEFEGSTDPSEFIEWLQGIERIFEAKGYSDEKRFKVASVKLTKYASLWFENMQHQRVREGKRKIKSWDKLKTLMRRRFVPASYTQDLYLQLTQLKQGNKSVIEYAREFEQLLIRTDVKESSEHTVARFVSGLSPTIAEKVELQPLWTLEDAIKLSLQVEKQLKNRRTYSKPFPTTSPTYSKGGVSSKGESSTKPEKDEKGKGIAKETQPPRKDQKR